MGLVLVDCTARVGQHLVGAGAVSTTMNPAAQPCEWCGRDSAGPHGPGVCAKPDRPRRAFELTIRVSADTWEDAVRELRSFTEHIEEHGPECEMISASGYVHIDHDPERTHDRYLADLAAWMTAKKAAER